MSKLKYRNGCLRIDIFLSIQFLYCLLFVVGFAPSTSDTINEAIRCCKGNIMECKPNEELTNLFVDRQQLVLKAIVSRRQKDVERVKSNTKDRA